jgi:hypothetical protein
MNGIVPEATRFWDGHVTGNKGLDLLDLSLNAAVHFGFLPHRQDLSEEEDRVKTAIFLQAPILVEDQ